MKWKEGEFYARGERGNLGRTTVDVIKLLEYSRGIGKTLRGKLPVRYQVLTLRFAVFGR